MSEVHTPPRRNIELKATDHSPQRSLQQCLAISAEDHGELNQRDTYFNVPHGRLKLREQQPGAQLIQFQRASTLQQRESRYRLIDLDDGPTLRAALQSALGVRTTVIKLRRLFIWQHVRIHLDEVRELGTFIELEAVAAPESDLTHEHELVRQLRETFAITDERLVGTGYAEQLLALVAYPLLVLALTGSPAKAGIVGFAKTFPIAALAIPAGVLVDRVNRKHVMIACDGARALALATIPIALAAGSVPYALIVTVAFIGGPGFIVSYIPERGALRPIVPREQLSQAVARNESRTFTAMLAGPPFGGFLFGISRAIPFLTDAISYTASTTSMLLIHSDFQERHSDAERGDLRAGLRWIWQRPFFRTCVILFAGGNPLLTGPALLIGGCQRARRIRGTHRCHARDSRHRRSARSATRAHPATTSLPTPGIGQQDMSDHPRRAPLTTHTQRPLLGLIAALTELLTPVTNSIVVSHRVALAPDHLQGRVRAASTLISFSAGWLGPLAVGSMLQNTGATATILTLTGWALLFAIAASSSTAIRNGPTQMPASSEA